MSFSLFRLSGDEPSSGEKLPEHLVMLLRWADDIDDDNDEVCGLMSFKIAKWGCIRSWNGR